MAVQALVLEWPPVAVAGLDPCPVIAACRVDAQLGLVAADTLVTDIGGTTGCLDHYDVPHNVIVAAGTDAGLINEILRIGSGANMELQQIFILGESGQLECAFLPWAWVWYVHIIERGGVRQDPTSEAQRQQL